MSKKMTIKQMNETVIRYALANEQKKEATAECKDLGETIKDWMLDKKCERFEAMGYTATLQFKNGKKLNLDKVAEALGGAIPEEFYEATQTVALVVKEQKGLNGDGPKPKMAVVAA
jgi:hypothetical protein